MYFFIAVLNKYFEASPSQFDLEVRTDLAFMFEN